jgi:DNA-3-methyladenine glycosylase II
MTGDRTRPIVGVPTDRALAARMRKACQHLAKAHPEFQRVIAEVGPCRLRPMPDPFAMLVSTVVSQQISVKAAESIVNRMVAMTKRQQLTAKAILAANEAELRACGLSSAKLRTIRELAARVADRRLRLDRLIAMNDDEVAEALLPIPGIGPWSVQMVLIFGLCRMDVLPVGDLGFRYGVRDLFGFQEAPSPEELEAMAEPWRPYRTVATWYVWRSRRMKLPSPK